MPWWEGLYLSAAYTFNDQFYTDFTEVINGVAFNRDGKQIPGVERSFLNSRLGYESYFGLGGWFEVNYQDSYFVNNSNTLRAPSYNVLNLDLHYARDLKWAWLSRIEAFLELQNLLDTTYIGSAVTVTDDVVNSAGLARQQAGVLLRLGARRVRRAAAEVLRGRPMQKRWWVLLVLATLPAPMQAGAQSETIRLEPLEVRGAHVFHPPQYRHTPLPSYPPAAREQGLGGAGLFEAKVMKDGRVGEVKVKQSTGVPVLDESAQRTIKTGRSSRAVRVRTPWRAGSRCRSGSR